MPVLSSRKNFGSGFVSAKEMTVVTMVIV